MQRQRPMILPEKPMRCEWENERVKLNDELASDELSLPPSLKLRRLRSSYAKASEVAGSRESGVRRTILLCTKDLVTKAPDYPVITQSPDHHNPIT
jgi:hypothetical protein